MKAYEVRVDDDQPLFRAWAEGTDGAIGFTTFREGDGEPITHILGPGHQDELKGVLAQAEADAVEADLDDDDADPGSTPKIVPRVLEIEDGDQPGLLRLIGKDNNGEPAWTYELWGGEAYHIAQLLLDKAVHARETSAYVRAVEDNMPHDQETERPVPDEVPGF